MNCSDNSSNSKTRTHQRKRARQLVGTEGDTQREKEWKSLMRSEDEGGLKQERLNQVQI